MGWVDPWVGLGWGVGPKWQISEKQMCTYVTVLSSNYSAS